MFFNTKASYLFLQHSLRLGMYNLIIKLCECSESRDSQFYIKDLYTFIDLPFSIFATFFLDCRT